jgi:hypothetical protein
MRKLSLLTCLFVALALFTGCATPMPLGLLYTDLKIPLSATGEVAKGKVGVGECSTVLGLVATGDCSIEAAMKNGGISKVSHVDWDAKSILGIFGTYRTTVYGE